MAESAARVARKRLLAREAGLCPVCFKTRPESGRSVCAPCSNAAAQRIARRRAEKRRIQKASAMAEAHEHAGDEAYARHVYEEAAPHYRVAANLLSGDFPGRVRILQKLAAALVLGRDPSAADPIFREILELQARPGVNPADTFEILLQHARQLFIAARNNEVVPVIERALEVAQALGDERSCKLANARLFNFLYDVGRFEEAARCVDAMGTIDDIDDPLVRTNYYTAKARRSAGLGKALETFNYYESAVDVGKNQADFFQLVRIWNGYALCALSLGNIELAKSCSERALFVAHQYNVTVLLPELSLTYVGILTRAGRYDAAHEHLLKALSHEVKAPFIDVTVVEYGIPLCLHMKDERVLARCVRPAAVDFAFQSRSTSLIAAVTSAFAQLYAADGRKRDAELLLHRALEVLPGISQRLDLPIVVARYGAEADLPIARQLLERLAKLPSSKVAKASLNLFDAFAAQRRGESSQMNEFALGAIRRFETLGWYGYADLARTVCLTAIRTSTARTRSGALSTMQSVLTAREQEVAELVLKGLTNREIGVRLGITKHTVDSHVGSIISRFGIRSRHQLIEAFPAPE